MRTVAIPTIEPAFITAIREIAMKTALFLALTVASSLAFADSRVNGYIKKDGTYVAPHYKSAPDSNPYNNYSTQGNSNPYTGQQGTRDAHQVQQQYANPYGSGNAYGQQPRQKNAW